LWPDFRGLGQSHRTIPGLVPRILLPSTQDGRDRPDHDGTRKRPRPSGVILEPPSGVILGLVPRILLLSTQNVRDTPDHDGASIEFHPSR